MHLISMINDFCNPHCSTFSFTSLQAKSFSRTLEIEEELGLRAEYKELLQAPLQEAMQACIVELQQHGWVNNNAVKLLVGLALTADHMHLAQNFLRYAPKHCLFGFICSNSPQK